MKKTTHIIKSNISSKWGKFVQQFRSYYPSVKDVDNIMLTEPIKIVIPYNLFPKNTKTKISARIILHVNSKNQVDDSNFDLIASRCRLIVVPDTDVRSHVQKRNLGVPIYVIKLTDLELWGTVVSFNPSNPHIPQEIEIHPSRPNYKKRVYIPETVRIDPCNWDEEIILLADRPDWAFGRIVERVYDKFCGEYKLKKKYAFTDKDNKRGIPLWWKQHNGFFHKDKSIVCLYDELSWQDSDVSFLANNYLGIAVSNKRIRKRVLSNKVVQDKCIPVYDIPDGVDTSFFSPAEKRPSKDKLQIGWCGNSKLNFFGFTDIKGFEILKQVAAATTDIADWHFVDREVNGIPFTSMPNFMRSLDIMTCASIGEGTPNPILEGLSCGLLGLSTEVGLLPELQDDGCIVEIVDRTVESFVSTIKRINKNREILAEARKKNPKIMKEKWDWNILVNKWKPLLAGLKGEIYNTTIDLRDKVTVFITTVGEDSFKEAVDRINQQTVFVNIEIIKDIAPMSAAFQKMIDNCKTPYYVQLDEDMLLSGNAIEVLYHQIKIRDNCAILVAPLEDCFKETTIVGIKIYNHNIIKQFPYDPSAFSCEIEQNDRILSAGYEIVNLFEDSIPSKNTYLLGKVNTKLTNEQVFANFRRDFQKVQLFPDKLGWLNGQIPIMLTKYKNTKDIRYLYAVLGAYCGLNAKPLGGEKDYRNPQHKIEFEAMGILLNAF